MESQGTKNLPAAEAARLEAAEYKDKYLRLLAEQDNYRKSLERISQDRWQEARKRLLRKLIAVSDDLERALAHAPSGNPLAEGIQLVYDQLQHVLAEEGVEVLEAVGQPFDPAVHEAVEVVPGDGEDDIVDAEMLKGYLHQGQLLRPAQVRVRKGT